MIFVASIKLFFRSDGTGEEAKSAFFSFMKFTFLVPSTDDSSARGYSLLFMSKRKGDNDYPDGNKHRRIDDPGDGQQRRKIPQADPPQPVPDPHGLRSNSKVFD